MNSPGFVQVGRIQCHVAIGLRSPLPCWLSPGACSQLLEAGYIPSLVASFLRLQSWQLSSPEGWNPSLASSLSDRMPLFCLFLPHTLGMEEVTLVVITQIAWTRYLLLLTQAPRPLQTCFWQSPKGHVTCVHELKTDSSVFLFCFSGFV